MLKILCKLKEEEPDFIKSNITLNLFNPSSMSFTFWNKIRKYPGFYEDVAIDLLYISIFVFGADRKVSRDSSFDCWSRDIEMYVPVLNKSIWNKNKNLLEDTLNFLSGDKWHFKFRDRKKLLIEEEYYIKQNKSKAKIDHYDKICMLSGGLDSFIGSIDILEQAKSNNEKILFVSHYGGGKGTKEYQDGLKDVFIKEYCVHKLDFQQFFAKAVGGKEETTRTRSFMFFAHAVALASALGQKVEIIIPENGFISLNVPLTPARYGTSSTRTTHPHYMKLFQTLLQNLGLEVTFINPYQFFTKGEMMIGCKNQKILKENISKTMSCSHPDNGRYHGINRTMHCGYCLPCTIRKAAIRKSGLLDTSEYLDVDYSSGETAKQNLNALRLHMDHFNPSWSVFEIQKSGLIEENIEDFSELYNRGMMELEEYLESAK